MGVRKYKVHSAIYSWDTPNSSTKPACNVTDIVQRILDKPQSEGVIPLNTEFINDPATGRTKTFAIVVSIVTIDGNKTTRFCSSTGGSKLDINNSGVECYF